MNALSDLRVQVFADGASKNDLLAHYHDPLIKGLTTNPTLMRKAGVADYEAFAREVLETVSAKPISFEVFSDELPEMRRQALKIASWQSNVYVKIPVTNSVGVSTVPLIADLANEGVKLNVTAILTRDQVAGVAKSLHPGVPAVVSVFAGRIADTGRDPIDVMKASLAELQERPLAQLLWASCREVLNIRHADNCGAHIITVTHDLLQKALQLWSKDTTELSLDTVRMFYRDALEAGYQL
jgi:transaldolase